VTYVSRQFHLIDRPKGTPSSQSFSLVERQLTPPGPKQLLVKNLWLSVDPYMRGRMVDQPSYIAPFGLNEPLDGAAVGVVIESRDDAFAPGDMVSHFSGWRDRAVIDASAATLIESSLPAQTFLGPLGLPGQTAYVGLLRIGAAKAGETVFISAAAGAVGSIAAQIAKIKGCRVIGSTGSKDKERWLLEEAGIDVVINYRDTPDITAALMDAAPEGIDVYFDNVGGDHLEAAISAANDFAHFPLCGMIGQYNGEPVGPRNIFQVVTKRIRMEGFIVTDHSDMINDIHRDISLWIKRGDIKWTETIVEGLENTPKAFIDLFNGKNTGKMIVRLDHSI